MLLNALGSQRIKIKDVCPMQKFIFNLATHTHTHNCEMTMYGWMPTNWLNRKLLQTLFLHRY